MLSKLSHISPYYRKTFGYWVRPEQSIFRRVIYDYELIYIEGGRGKTVFFDDSDSMRPAECFDFAPGDFIFYRPGQRHGFWAESFVTQPHIHFDLIEDELSSKIRVSYSDITAMSAANRTMIREDILADYPIPKVFTDTEDGYFKSLFYRCIQNRDNTAYSPLCFKVHLTEMAAILTSRYPKKETDAHANRLDDVIEFISQYYNGNTPKEPLSLEMLAEKFFISKYHLLRSFKERFGVTPIRYAAEICVKRANELLSEDAAEIAEIAAVLGFGSSFSFSRFYKRLTGITPGAARRTGKGEQQ